MAVAKHRLRIAEQVHHCQRFGGGEVGDRGGKVNGAAFERSEGKDGGMGMAGGAVWAAAEKTSSRNKNQLIK